MPQVVYMGDVSGEAELLEALRTGQIDAVARGEIGNLTAGQTSMDALVVSAVDTSSRERGGFTFAVHDADLAACIDDRLNWLTDNQRLGYAEWHENPGIFMQRAAQWGQ